MFRAAERLPRSQFPTQGSLAKSAHSAHLTLVAPSVGRGYAVVVSKKVAKLSVRRHLLKRRLLALLRAAPQKPPALLILPKQSAAKLSFAELQADLYNLLPKIAE